uniref:NEDD8-activating enzyme E1 regulatory subunit n=1 Tax=Syphacia muris TaxID=451379 RepID=A0A158R4J3_9BILA
MTEKDVRYDRQLRLWGDEGQNCIEHANVCVLGSSALATEILKNLVLAGVKYVYIVDGTLVTEPDLGNNFFLEPSDIGRSRAKATLQHLKELNPMVKGDYDCKNLEDFVINEISTLARFTIVVGANLIEKVALEVSKYLFDRNIPFVNAKILGFAGYVRVCVKEHTIINSHEENEPLDLRLDKPFSALSEMVNAIELESLPYEVHSHTPYLLLYLKALELWREQYSNEEVDSFPDNYQKRKQFEQVFLDLRMEHPEHGSINEENFMEGKAMIVRCMRKTTVPPKVCELLKDEKAEHPNVTSFWIFVAALKRFVAKHNALPVYNYALCILLELKLKKDFVRLDECLSFCKNAVFLRVQHGTSLEQEANSHLEDVLASIRNVELKVNSITSRLMVPPCIWYLLMKAVDRFYVEKWRYPGCNGVPCTIDSHDLMLRVVSLVQDSDVIDANELLMKIPKEAVDEICRYGNSELHVISSLIGGVAAQEVIKLATHQYIPLENCFVFDGHTQQSATFKL